MADEFNISNDDFIRTTEERHYAASQAIWKAMAANGDIYKGGYAGWYSVRDEAYYGEEETELRADGVRYGPQGTPVEWVEEESYFFRLSAYGERLLDFRQQPVPGRFGRQRSVAAHRHRRLAVAFGGGQGVGG